MLLLTKKQSRVLRAMEETNPFSMDGLLERSRLASASEVEAVLMELFHLDYVTSIRQDHTGAIVEASLSTMGKNYRELRGMEQRERWKERGIGFLFGVLSSAVAALLLHFTVGIG